jgi:molybdopterin-containing oxidoreductase family iron-sulfur binding subunit
VTILQPLIAPLFAGKTAHELIAAFSEQPDTSAHDIVKAYWKGKLPGSEFEGAWRKALHDGVVEGSAFPAKSVTVRSAAAPETQSAQPGTGLTVLFRPDPTIWDGSYANNGWLQELAKPLTKLTWESAALISPATAQKLGVTTEASSAFARDGSPLRSGSRPARRRTA